MLDMTNITETQLLESALAMPAFLPVMLFPGYLAAWFTNLHGFRSQTLVERAMWSVPLSLAVSAISCVLIGRFLSLDAVVAFLLACAVIWVATVAWEWRSLRGRGIAWRIGWRPLGGMALGLVFLWVAMVLLLLVDIQHGQRLLMNVALSDESARINWTQSVLNTGIPPANPLYRFAHLAPMRNYYFWYVLCAAITRLSHLSVRAVTAAGCAWAGLALIALNGLYLKHFLRAGQQLRRQLLQSIALLMSTGLLILVVAIELFAFHIVPSADFDFWAQDPIFGWVVSVLWAPHHIAGLVCCMLAFLLAWPSHPAGARPKIALVSLIAFALASSFGLSVYVTIAFFLVMMAWALWQLFFFRAVRSALMLAAGGAGGCVLLLPYLRELLRAGPGPRSSFPLGFGVREMIPPETLLNSSVFRSLTATHPTLSLNFAKLLLLVPGYALELGFYFIVLLIYLVPAWRDGRRLTREQQSLAFIACSALIFVSFIRSEVIRFNDFGFRGALLVQFCLLLLATQMLTSWNTPQSAAKGAAWQRNPPRWLRSVTAIALVIGVFGAMTQTLWDRFVTSMGEWNSSDSSGQTIRSFSHNAYISALGYAQLDAAIPNSAVVQYNPATIQPFWVAADQVGVGHQVVIAGDRPWCGAELGGDPSGCASMADAIDALYNGQSAEEARATCHALGIQYLIARVYDPVWQQRNGWVWTLPPVVADNEFRALDCR